MTQLDLFSSNIPVAVVNSQRVNDVPGLRFIEEFISAREHDFLLAAIDREPWLSDLKRRVQHYGYKYNYKSRSIDHDMFIGPLPDWSMSLCRRLVADKLISYQPDQIIVNEYLPGQGIANHIDCTPCFNDTIISLSLLSPCVMDLISKHSPQTKIELLLPPRSLVVLSGESRYLWTHGIAGRKIDDFEGAIIKRSRRISLTFRKVILSEQRDCDL